MFYLTIYSFYLFVIKGNFMPKNLKPSLLELAMTSLNSQQENTRDKIFQINQDTVKNIINSDSVKTCIGSLRIQPNINGMADNQPAQPLVKGNTINVDLNKITLPSKLGGGTLKNTIIDLCYSNNILFDSHESINRASYTPVITAIAGQHDMNDADCKGVTKAEFVPVFDAGNSTKRVLAISYSSNGETGIRTDVLKVSGSMTCLGRANKNSTSMQAIEIPNDIAMEVSNDNPELFKKLQENSCMVVFVEFNLQQDNYNTYESSYRGSGERGVTRGYSDEGNSKGISGYSVIGQGSSTQDMSITIGESGIRKLSQIYIYNVGALVVNTNEKKLSSEQSKTIVDMMKLRVDELNNLSNNFKAQDYTSLLSEMNEFLRQFGVNTKTSDIFEHAMLKLAEITEQPKLCKTCASQKTPEYFFMDFGLSVQSINQLQVKLREIFGRNFCEYTPQFNQGGSQAMRFPIIEVMANMSAIQKCINEILSNPRNLFAYQQYSNGNSDAAARGFNTYNSLLNKAGLSPLKSHCFEIVFTKMFGCDEELSAARFTKGKDYIGEVADFCFYLRISDTAAKNLVNEINKCFPGQYAKARFIRSDARVADKGNIRFCEIIIDTSLLISEPFLNLFTKTLNNLIENEPLLIERLRIKSYTQDKTSEQHANDLLNIAARINNTPLDGVSTDKVQAITGLASSLESFSTILTSSDCTRSKRLEASDNLRRHISLYEFFQNHDENRKFKDGDKKEIKSIQKSLGFGKNNS